MPLVYKILSESLWQEALAKGRLDGAPVDLTDGFIHFSDASQVEETAARHFAGQTGLMLLAIEAETLGPALKWEVSRGGALFPHLHAPLPVAAVLWSRALPQTAGGGHDFSGLLA